MGIINTTETFVNLQDLSYLYVLRSRWSDIAEDVLIGVRFAFVLPSKTHHIPRRTHKTGRIERRRRRRNLNLRILVYLLAYTRIHFLSRRKTVTEK